jgi:hypothetical protein
VRISTRRLTTVLASGALDKHRARCRRGNRWAMTGDADALSMPPLLHEFDLSPSHRRVRGCTIALSIVPRFPPMKNIHRHYSKPIRPMSR